MQGRRPGPPRPSFHLQPAPLPAALGIPGALIIAIVSAGLTACQTGPTAEGRASATDSGRPSLTNAEHEMAQLRALGAIGDRSLPAVRPDSVHTMPDLVRGESARLIPPVTSSLPRAAAVAAPPSTATARPPAPRSGPVQKIGSSYIGPGGATSRRVGSIMLNSDGTTGQLIGNTIIKH